MLSIRYLKEKIEILFSLQNGISFNGSFKTGVEYVFYEFRLHFVLIKLGSDLIISFDMDDFMKEQRLVYTNMHMCKRYFNQQQIMALLFTYINKDSKYGSICNKPA